jgi:hypothetical protein
VVSMLPKSIFTVWVSSVLLDLLQPINKIRPVNRAPLENENIAKTPVFLERVPNKYDQLSIAV